MMTMTFNGDEQDQMALGQGSTTTHKGSKGGGCFGVLFGGLFFLIGLGISTYAFTEWRNSADIENWPSIEGIIESGHVSTDTDDDGDTDYTPNITYSYSVDNQRYTGNRITYFSKSYNSSSDAQAVLNRYPIRTEVMVYYDPDKHSRAVLEPNPDDTTPFLMMGFGAIFGVVGLAIAVGTTFASRRASS